MSAKILSNRAGNKAGGTRRAAGAIGRLALLAAPALLAAADVSAAPAPVHAHMAPAEAYLMDRTEEIALAKSAAPAAIADKATVLVLTRAGYETAVKGSNGFVCLVERGFSGAPDWNERWIRASAQRGA
jgi:hypothetical protein